MFKFDTVDLALIWAAIVLTAIVFVLERLAGEAMAGSTSLLCIALIIATFAVRLGINMFLRKTTKRGIERVC